MIGAFIFTACDDDDDDDNAALSGYTFLCDDGDYFTFNKSGNGFTYTDDDGDTYTGTYTVSGNVVTFTVGSESLTGTYNSSTKILTVWGYEYYRQESSSSGSGSSSSTSAYFQEAVDALGITASPQTIYTGIVKEDVSGYTYSDDCTLALYSDGSCLFAMEKSYGGKAMQAAGYYSYTYTKSGSTITLSTSDQTYIRKTSSIYNNQNVLDGCVQYEITVSGSTIKNFEY